MPVTIHTIKKDNDGDVNAFEANNMKGAAGVSGFHTFAPQDDMPTKCDKCGKGKSSFMHKGDGRVKKDGALKEWNDRRMFKDADVDLSKMTSSSDQGTTNSPVAPMVNTADAATSDRARLADLLLSGKWPSRKKGTKKVRHSSNGAWVSNGNEPAITIPALGANAIGAVGKSWEAGGSAITSTAAGRMRFARVVATVRKRRTEEVKKAEASGKATVIRKDQTGATHHVTVQRGWETDPATGNKKWRVSLNNNEDHEFPDAKSALAFAYSGNGMADTDEGGE